MILHLDAVNHTDCTYAVLIGRARHVVSTEKRMAHFSVENRAPAWSAGCALASPGGGIDHSYGDAWLPALDFGMQLETHLTHGATS